MDVFVFVSECGFGCVPVFDGKQVVNESQEYARNLGSRWVLLARDDDFGVGTKES